MTDEAQLLDWVRQHASPDCIGIVLSAAQRLRSDAPEQQSARQDACRHIFRRIVLAPSAMRFEVDPPALISLLLEKPAEAKREHELGNDASDQASSLTVIERSIIIKRRGIEARIVVGGNASAAREPDPALITLLGRAHTYLRHLTDGSASSIAELAERIGVHRADISRVLPLAFLSPSVTAAILSGRQPVEMTARSIARLVDVPASWRDQAALLLN